MLMLADLWVSQEWLRKEAQIEQMIWHVMNGGLWTRKVLDKWAEDRDIRKSPLIQINKFEDGLLMIQDGHHRIVSTILGERDFLLEEEFELQNWSYSEYEEINIANGWYTPYNPRTEIRLEDLADYKKKIRKLLESSESEAVEYITKNKNQYVLPRTIKTVVELSKQFTGAKS